MSGSGAPRVSICIPAYEQVTYLQRTLSSIVEQDFPDLEVIVTDDSTSNAVEELVSQYTGPLGSRLRYQRNRPAHGTPGNWNTAIDLARGDLVKIMHHDEWFAAPDSLRAFVDLIDRSGADFVFSAVQTTVVKTGRTWILCPSDEEVATLLRCPDRILLANIIGPPSSTIHKRSLGLRYDERFRYVVDMVYYRAALLKHKVDRTKEVLVLSVSDAGHNVTGTSKTPDVELREYCEAFDDRMADMPAAVKHDVERFIFGLLVTYGVTDRTALRRHHPKWNGKGPYGRLLLKAKLYRTLRPLFGGKTARLA